MTTDATGLRMAEDLGKVGVRRGGILLVHSSLSSLGHVPGGPEAVIGGLLTALGPEGTLLLPALSYELVGPEQPVFDVRNTPSNVGAIPEHFRARPGTLRSMHPTHSVCGVGSLARDLLSDHHLDDTPVGPRSPLRYVRDRGGQILFLGCGLRPNTSMHGVEELADAPYLFGSTHTYRMVGHDGTETLALHRHHGFDRWDQRYDRIESLLAQGTEIRTGRVLQARVYLIQARPMWARALDAMRSDPFYFVERRQMA